MVERIRILLETKQLTPTQFADAIGIARPIVSHILSGRNKPSLEVVQRILAAMPDISMPWLLNGSGAMLSAPLQASPVMVQPQSTDTQMQSGAGDVQAGFDNRVPTPLESPVTNPPQSGPAADIAARVRRSPANSSPPSEPVSLAHNRPVPKRFAPAPKAPAVPVQPAEPNPPVAEPVVVPIAIEAPSKPDDEVIAGTAGIMPPTSANNAPAATIPAAAALFAGGEKPIRRIVIFYRDGSFADYQPE